MTEISLPVNNFANDLILNRNASSLDTFNGIFQPSATGQKSLDVPSFQNFITSEILKMMSSNEENETEDTFWSGLQPTNPFQNQTASSLFGTSGVFDQMVAKANLIGKIVEAVDPKTGEKVSGTVKGVSVQGGSLSIEIGDKIVPPENLLSIRG
ncbi:hypothetical protein A2526_02145 [candidate division WOR-1 bacterium RIFOXYD2_FULL_36_8]|uniref:Uncharacterized protein n=1 Tax=candidate division WOR-1 bacterium RIFOXYB2_FULL_36_35 TaxID=1802578 RepID=A0A1F4S290_UNCSA|nr:MAG: hypothetical protein A2230_06225 [candidate division WOR-1 bacterium RIFOXYA2_FULL_36_21]OGC14554.1 MAG: hypothetical protein A2290_01735 [candidate division WOR-1 bacterium RIFOXYB2_FULL_36_35]OGC16226.1 MAG: hypothetical protein A2282_01290 [candidate division WOR-1 bacterium RIFOXYA12_FULL_36_13]OGC38330.1 MAG: hypothetical protein A2526_02145 [candidate division WOR-1 bacterium RIFOXYD2_FULL_36_8]